MSIPADGDASHILARRWCPCVGLRRRGHSINAAAVQLFLAVMANTLLHVRSTLELPQCGQATEPVPAPDIGREISKVLWQSWQVNS
jgi:hypothetical protein